MINDPLVGATLLALLSAVLHATWNFLVKTSDDRFLQAWGQFVFGGLIFLPVLVVIGGVPGFGDVWPYLLVTGLVHVFYITALVRAYHHGDFSLAYPVARGTGALLAALGGVLFLGDTLPATAWLAIAVVVSGLVLLAGRNIHVATIAWAMATGVTIGTYTTVDSAGSRASEGFAYGIAVTLAAGLALTAAGTAAGRLPALIGSLRTQWWRYSVAGVLLTTAYALVLIAVRWAPVGYVAVLRESSVVLGALAGWLLLGEQPGHRRVAASLVVAFGLGLLIVFR